MRVTVRLFARLRELAGESEWSCEVSAAPDVSVATPSGATPSAAIPRSRFARWSSVSCAVNAQFARMRAPVRDGDDVAFLPPVSGG